METNTNRNEAPFASAFESHLDLSWIQDRLKKLQHEIDQVLVGQQELKKLLYLAFLSKGHVLLEGVPGVAKTLSARLLAQGVEASFKRIQFTPDLMPSDITGTRIYHMKKESFSLAKGPIFANMVLADEINRAPAKTQAALFEAMEEQQVTIDGERHGLGEFFMVLATQNPIDMEGTYRLPEAQMDRFMFKITVDQPGLEEEIRILELEHTDRASNKTELIKPCFTMDEVRKAFDLVGKIHIEPKLVAYIARLSLATREHPDILLGASPRASISLLHGAKAHALFSNRDFVTPEDIKPLVLPVMAHRIILNPDKELEGMHTHDIIKEILNRVEAPK